VAPDAIEAALRQLQPGTYGWRSELPARFLGQQVGLRIDTRANPTRDPPAPPSPVELDLVRLILGGLPGVLTACEQAYQARYAAYPQLVSGVRESHVWVCRDFPGGKTPEDWAFVIGVTGDPNWATHADFRGLELLGMWSGD
jgi:hypothetical protein